MYTKLFSKILDSSIWLTSASTRLVWITLLAAKERDQIARFSTVKNLAIRAGVPLADAEKAVLELESPDPERPDQEHEGRRIERVDGGWFVIKGAEYDAIRNKEDERRRSRVSMRKLRLERGQKPENVTNVTDVTPVAVSASATRNKKQLLFASGSESEHDFEKFWQAWAKKKKKGDAKKAWDKAKKQGKLPSIDDLLAKVSALQASHDWTKESRQYQPYPASWLNAEGWHDEPEEPVSLDDEQQDHVWNAMMKLERDRPELKQAGLDHLRECDEQRKLKESVQ